MILQQERRRGRGESEYCDFSCYKTPIFLYSWTQKGEKNEILILRSFNRSFRIMIRNMKDTYTSCFPVPSDPLSLLFLFRMPDSLTHIHRQAYTSFVVLVRSRRNTQIDECFHVKSSAVPSVCTHATHEHRG
jgi:hypothetical protein